MIDKNFYRAFEDRHRGSRELIKSRLSAYLPFIIPLKSIYAECKVVDLGCGRGEWLELMRDEGIEAQGVDIDEDMLIASSQKSLSVLKEDAIKYLLDIPDERVVVVSAFHIAEHLHFDELQTLVKASFRVLRPGGLLILETPNPENLVVGTANFYLDPTHQRPVPPSLLSFLAEYYGFARIKIIRLQESSGLVNSDDIRLFDVITGVSPDYAVIAQKNAPAAHLSLFDAAFDKEYGITLEALSMRYETKTRQAVAEAATLRERTQWLKNEWNASRAKIDELNGQAHHWRTVADSLNRELQAVYASRSWRITRPLRVAFGVLLRVRAMFSSIPRTIKHGIGGLFSSILARLIRFALDHPTLKARALTWVCRYPALEVELRRFAVVKGIIAGSMSMQISPEVPDESSAELSRLTPSANRIYVDLKAAIERHNKGGY